MSLESDVIAKITPTLEDRKRIDSIAAELKGRVQKYMDEHGIDAELMFVGSYSKDTYLASPDLDLFMMFPVGTPRRELVDIGLEVGEKVLHGTRMYAEHPYTSAVFEGVDVDLVPNIHIKDTEHMETAVDRTPFHTKYLNSRMKPEDHGQIRLLKKFMKGIGTYGAEPRFRGFSGYLCEILVLKYGSFRGVLEAAANEWKVGMRIWIEEEGPEMHAPLVFYDPVDRKRNVASAVHEDTLSRFIVAAKDYLAHPSEVFFFPPRNCYLSDAQIEAAAHSGMFRLISVVFDKPDTAEDNMYAQLWKTRYALQDQLQRHDFVVLHAAHGYDGKTMTVIFMLTCDRLPKSMKRIGPDVDAATADGFLTKWGESAIVKPYIEDGKWCAVIPRTYISAKEMLRDTISQAGIGKNIDPSKVKILDHDRTVAEGDRTVLSELLDPTPIWRR